MRFWGALGAALVLATILAYKLDGQAFALLTGMLAMAVIALFLALMFASRNQYEVQRAPKQEQQQPVAPVIILLAGDFDGYRYPRWSIPKPQEQLPTPSRQWAPPVEQSGWQQPEPTWGGLWDEPEAQPQAQRRFKVVGEREPWGGDR